ncbi:MAG: hypothetical protein CMN77_04580 [Spirochaetaceae bacterium]|nr:hypothetical protein [Spirochaetaceae bacterium]
MNRILFITATTAFSALMGTHCVTTNINSPGHATRGGEDAFFQELSEQDDAFESRPAREPRTRDASQCDCDPRSSPPGYAHEDNTRTNPDSGYDRNPNQDRRVTVDENVATNVEPEDNELDHNKPETTDVSLQNFTLTGTASWYGRDFDGKPTASGEIFDSRKLTGAHKELPLGTIVMVKNLENDKEVMLKINDRGPFVEGRILDVSEYAAEVLGFKEQGLTTVGIRVIRTGDKKKSNDGATAEFFKDGHKNQPLPSEKDLNENEIQEERSFKDYSVQVGMFSTLENANRMKTFLQKFNQPVFILRRSNGEFVVRVGQFNERYPAEQLKLKLSSEGYSGFVSEPVY